MAEIDLREGLGARTTELLEAVGSRMKDAQTYSNNYISMPGIGAFTEGLGLFPTDEDYAELEKFKNDTQAAFEVLKEAGMLGAEAMKNGNGDYLLDLNFDLNSVNGIIDAHARLGEMLRLVDDEAGQNNAIFTELNAQYERLDAAVNNYTDSVGELNKNLANQYMLDGLINAGEVPDTQEEFDAYRQSVIDAAIASGEFVGSTEQIISAIDGVLRSDVSFAQFYDDVADSSSDAATEAEDATSTINEAIDAVQSKLSTLSGALTKLQEGSLGINDVIDLLQQFPELATYVDLTADGFGDLEQGLRDLIKASPDDLIEYLQEFKETKDLTEEQKSQIDNLCAALSYLPIDAVKDVTDEFGRLAEQIKAAADEYNNLTNGNVDYNKRPIVPSSDMRKVYPDYDGDYATTYSQYHTIGEEGVLYTIDITPILEDGTVLSQEALDEYVSNLITDNGVAGVLASDTSNLIINIQPGDYDEEYWSAYQETLGEVKNRHMELVEQLKAKEHNLTLGKVAREMSGAFEQLDTIYADIVDGKDFDWESILNNQQFEDTFGDLGGVYDDFIKTVASSPDDISACQSAFDELATAYILNSDALKDVTDDTRNATIAMLEQMGVANAAAIVDERIALNKETARLQSELHADATHEEVLALYDEETATRITAQAIFELAIAKIQTNENAIVTSSDIDQLEALAKSAGASTESLLNLAKAKALMAEAEGYKAASDAALKVGDLHGHMFNLRKSQAALKQAEEYYNKPLTYDVDFSQYKEVSYTGGSVTQSEKDKSGKSKEETWFEKQLSLHQHLVAMNQETQEEYLAWMNTAYKQAYDEGIIELDDYYKYAEEVYTGLQDLFKDYLSDVEHEISMRENYDGEAKKIIELYEGLIENVEKEIAAARSRGLTDEDDYIQELQKKWQDYAGSIKDLKDEITESAKDALDELVDYRIDMLRKDIEDEKDALDKRLDNLKEFYDKQKEMLQDQRDEENYLKDQSEKRGTVADLQAELAMLANDDSAWAQKRKLELQEELATAQEDLDEFEKDHALDLALDALDKAYNDQEAQIQAEMDALEERLNDPEALYNKALEDIRKNSENQLYYQMLMYNRQYGDGNDETVKDLWESAFGSLSDYEKLFGELYKGVGLENETGVEDEGGWDDETISGTNPDNQHPTPPPPADDPADEPEKPAAPQLTDEIKTKVAAAIWNGGYGWGNGSTRTDRLTEVFGADNGIQDLVNNGVGKSGVSLTSDYTYENMRKKFKGYASGTDNATPGWHELFEGDLDEYVFTSSDGNKYRMFSGLGDKVLNAKGTDFLYKFAMSGGEFLSKMFGDLRSGAYIDKIVKPMQAFEIIAGDIIVQGNADSKTVSEIRRAQRDNLDYVLKEFAKLKK